MRIRTRDAVVVVTVALALALACSVWRDNRTVRVHTTRVSIAGLPAAFHGYTILLASDLHGASFGERQRGIRQACGHLHPDVIVLAGDLADSDHPDLGNVSDFLTALPEGVPCAFVEGNSDQGLSVAPPGEDEPLHALLSRRGTDVSERPLVIERAGSTLALCFPAYAAEDTASVATAATADIRIAVVHSQPGTLDTGEMRRQWLQDRADAYNPADPNAIGVQETEAPPVFSDFALLLAGHTHGGQARLPVLGAVYAPGLGFLPRKSAVRGLSRAHGRAQYVTAGLGAASAVGFLDRYSGPGRAVIHTIAPIVEAVSSIRVFNPATLDVIVLEGG